MSYFAGYLANASRAIALAPLVLFALPANATLVTVVPARDGLAIAADSRFTFMGAPCDGAFKIIEPERPLRNFVVRMDSRGTRAEAARMTDSSLGPRSVHQPVRTVPIEQAAAIAADVVKAASQAAQVNPQINPPASGIGGRVRVVIVASGSRPLSRAGVKLP